MAMQQKEKKEHKMTSTDILDRLYDGKIVDRWEMYDRMMLSQQLNILLSVPPKQTPTRVR
jgi:hypothetical protein